MKKINICFFIGSFRAGGGEKQLLELLKKIDRRKFNPVLCVFHKKGELVKDFEKLNIPIEEFTYNKTTFLSIIHLPSYVRLLRRKNIDIVHNHLIGCAPFSVVGAKLAKTPGIIMGLHNVYLNNISSHSKFILRYITKLVDKIVANAKVVKYYNSKSYNIDSRKIIVIYNGINLDTYINANRKNIREELGIGKAINFAGTVGSLSPQKGFITLLTAASAVIKAVPHTQFLIVGNGNQKKKLEQYSRKLGIRKNITFTGYRKDIPTILAGLDLFILPSLWEGCSNVIMEAMASGKPVIATDVGGNRELVVNNKTGFIIPPRNPEALANAIVRVINDKSLGKDMGVRGRARIKNNFSIERRVKKLENLYENLIKQKSSQ